MKLYGWLVSPLIIVVCQAADVTYRVTENAAACTEIRIPKWTRPSKGGDPTWPVGSWGCEYDVRSPDGSLMFLGLSCGSPSLWRMKEKYVLDLRKPQSVRTIDEANWEAAAVWEPWHHYGDPANAKFEPNGMAYRGHLYPKTGSEWDLYTKALSSPGDSRVAVYSFNGVVQRSYEPSFGPERFDGTYWTEIYDSASAKRLVQIRGLFHGVDLTELQGKSYWLTGRYFVQPLGVKGMGRALICDIDAAARSSGVAETDAPVPVSRAKPYLNHTRSLNQMRFFKADGPQAHVTGFRDEAVLCPGSNNIRSLNVTAFIDVQVPGMYWLELRLNDQNGRGAQERTGAELHSGKDMITVVFSAELLRMIFKTDGPYSIYYGQLIRNLLDGQVLAENISSRATTQSYSLERIASQCPSGN